MDMSQIEADIAQVIKVGRLVASLLPVAGTFVTAVESAMPSGTPGAAKLDAVRTGMESIYTASGQVSVAFDAIWPHIQKFVAALVAINNSLGIFRKSVPAPQ